MLIEFAEFHRQSKNFSQAEKLLHEAAREHLRNFGYGNAHFAFAYLQLSHTFATQGKFPAAEKTLKKAFRFLHLAGGADVEPFAFMLRARGKLFAKMNRIDAAREAYRETIEFLQRINKPRHFLLEDVNGLINNLAPNAGGGS